MEEMTKYFEIVRGPYPKVMEPFRRGETREIFCAGDEKTEEIWFRPVELSDEERDRLSKERENWELVDKYEWVDENLVYDDTESGEGERVVTDELLVSFLTGRYMSNQVRGGYLLEGGHFAGYLLKLEDTSSFGMAYSRSTDFGILLTDGRKIGRTDYHYFHSSTELSEKHSSVYSVRPVETAQEAE